MRNLLNVGISLCFISLAGINLTMNPFLPQAYAYPHSCEGNPPDENVLVQREME